MSNLIGQNVTMVEVYVTSGPSLLIGSTLLKMGCYSNTPHAQQNWWGAAITPYARRGMLTVHHQEMLQHTDIEKVSGYLAMISSRMRILISY